MSSPNHALRVPILMVPFDEATITATFTAQGAYTVAVYIDDDPLPRAATSFGVFLQ